MPIGEHVGACACDGSHGGTLTVWGPAVRPDGEHARAGVWLTAMTHVHAKLHEASTSVLLAAESDSERACLCLVYLK